mgnify:FL=1
MTALLVLLLAAASAVDSFDWASRAPVRARLLVGVPVVSVLGVLVGWPILHLGAEGVVVVLVTIAWLCCGLVPRTWWEKLSRSRQWEQVGRCGSESGEGRAMRLARLARAGLLLLAVALCVVVCQPLGSRAAKMSAAVGIVIFLAAPANRIVSDVLAAARQSPQGDERPSSSEAPMRGGHWIGPLERILILLLASVEAPAAVAAIVAAKGVIRFPEVSKDEVGQKAEEFLIGSFASWVLAVLGVIVIHVS